MESLGALIGRAASWRRATGVELGQDVWRRPLLGLPWDHACDRLLSSRLTVSVVIPVWNSAPSIGPCLRSLALSSLNRLAPDRLEVILCDDGSTDQSWDAVAANWGALDLSAYRLTHRSQSAALNVGLERASGDLVVFCDSDIVVGCGAIDELAARHEHWRDAVCFGFRSNIQPTRIATTPIWSLTHAEGFSADNRVAFDLPTLVPNMLDANDWLGRLDAGRHMLDSQGSDWPRHRFVYGCLFSARRDQISDVGGFPDAMVGWGYNDTLVAARLEAAGGFLLPVTSAWGHHITHELRAPDQWFQMRRNDLAYRHMLDEPLATATWRAASAGEPLDILRSPRVASVDRYPATGIRYGAPALAGVGRWEECLAARDADLDLAMWCHYRLGRYADAVRLDGADRSVWGALCHQRLGDTDRASKTLVEAAAHDPHGPYLLSASVPELTRLARHYASHGMPETSDTYGAAADLQAERDGCRPAPQRTSGAVW